jgi:hypothetical protein
MAAQAATFLAVTEDTLMKQNWHLAYYYRFLEWLELNHDPFLDTLDPSCTYVIRESSLTPTNLEDFPLLCALIHEYQELVVMASTLWLRQTGLTGVAAPATTPVPNSQKTLLEQLKGSKNNEPSACPQKALTPSILWENCVKMMMVPSTAPHTNWLVGCSSLL